MLENANVGEEPAMRGGQPPPAGNDVQENGDDASDIVAHTWPSPASRSTEHPAAHVTGERQARQNAENDPPI